jgi:hypothetical protein
MPDTKILRDITGFGDELADLTDAALIMMDCQNTYHKGVYRRKKGNHRSAATADYYAATINDVVGIAMGQGYGNAIH